jgi:hypothetical protein
MACVHAIGARQVCAGMPVGLTLPDGTFCSSADHSAVLGVYGACKYPEAPNPRYKGLGPRGQ